MLQRWCQDSAYATEVVSKPQWLCQGGAYVTEVVTVVVSVVTSLTPSLMRP